MIVCVSKVDVATKNAFSKSKKYFLEVSMRLSLKNQRFAKPPCWLGPYLLMCPNNSQFHK